MLKPTIGAILLIIGTAIGAGMIALPVITSKIGFVPSIALLFIVWYAMYLSSLLMLEANLSLNSGANIISMAKHHLGVTGETLAWTVYLLLLYVLNIAYLSSISDLFQLATNNILHIHVYKWLSLLILACVFTTILTMGAKTIDRINRVLMVIMVVSFIFMIACFAPNINTKLLLSHSNHGFAFALPAIVTSFGYQIIIPSLRKYLKSNTIQIKKVIFLGSITIFVIYLLWQFLIFGIIPRTGQHSLISLLESARAIDLSQTIAVIIKNDKIKLLIEILTFALISTSFIGGSMSLFDFLADGFALKKINIGRLPSALLTFTPPLIFILTINKGFYEILGYGGILVAILLCLFPAAMVIAMRNKQQTSQTEKNRIVSTGGIIFVILFAITVIAAELFS